ncbi:MAG: right-handed parallel beta-helix repeat-containing protein, partial [bacterium]
MQYAILFLIICHISLSTAEAKVLVVDSTGKSGIPLLSVAANSAGAGDTVLVKPGTYSRALVPKSDITILSEQGPAKTRLFLPNGGRAVYFNNVENVTVDGLDIYSVLGTGSAIDGLVNVDYSRNIRIKNCYIHDAGNDGDCIKVWSTQDLLIENCAVWNPAKRSSGNFQECMDTRGGNDNRITLRGCWFFHKGTWG